MENESSSGKIRFEGNPATLLADGVHPGDLLMTFAALAYALYGVLPKRWRVGLPTWQPPYMQALLRPGVARE